MAKKRLDKINMAESEKDYSRMENAELTKKLVVGGIGTIYDGERFVSHVGGMPIQDNLLKDNSNESKLEELTKKLRTETITVLKDKKVVGQAVISEIDNFKTNVSQSNFSSMGIFSENYEQTKVTLENHAKKLYGEKLEIKYSNLNEVKK